MATPVVKIGQACDGISIQIDEYFATINQEDNIAEELAKAFRYLGYETQTFEDY